MNNRVLLFLLIAVMAGFSACGKSKEKLLALNPQHVALQFFGTWKKKDWKSLYKLTDSAFMRALRSQKLPPELQRMSDEELFVHQFKETQRRNPGKVLKSYQVEYITPYKKGDTTLWVYATVNGRKKKIAMTLDGMSLKIDLTRVEDLPGHIDPSQHEKN